MLPKPLEKQLDQAKAEVVNLEQKLALAKHGVTDEVIEERKDLQQALQKQGKHVREELSEAQREANELNSATEKAQTELQRVPMGERAQTQLKTET